MNIGEPGENINPDDENVLGDEELNPNPEEDTVLLGKEGVIEAIKKENDLLVMIEKIKKANYNDEIANEIKEIMSAPVKAFKGRLGEIEQMLSGNSFFEEIDGLEEIDGIKTRLGEILKSKLLNYLKEKSEKES